MTNEIKTKKLTKKDYFNALKNDIMDTTYVAGIPTTEVLAFIDKELAQLAKKNAPNNPNGKKTEKQVENDRLIDKIYNILFDATAPLTITEIQKSDDELKEYSINKVSALVQLMIKAQTVVRTEEKRKAYFSLAQED